jgi:hypothetical protein
MGHVFTYYSFWALKDAADQHSRPAEELKKSEYDHQR